jgi:hypothetical protein
MEKQMIEIEYLAIGINEESKDWAFTFLIAAAACRWTNDDGEEFFLGKTGKISLFTSEWDSDERELWEIPEARKLFLFVVNQASKYGLGKKSIYKILDDQTIMFINVCELKEQEDA